MANNTEIQQELEEIGPALSRILNTTPYTPPPAGYFEQLPTSVLAEIQQAKVVGMVPRTNRWRFAAAAAIAGALIIGAWLFTEKRSPNGPAPLAEATSAAPIQQGIQQVSDSDMANYVNVNDISGSEDVPSLGPISDEDIDLVLADVSDQELQQYLDQDDVSPKLN